MVKGDTSGKPLEGVNLIPYVEGENKGVPHEALFWRMDSGTKWAVRTPEAKYFLPRNETGLKGPFLVDMVNDPYESTNIIDKDPKLRKKLAKLWNAWNAKNKPNKYLQAGAYQKERLKFYKELRERLDKKAEKEKPVVIE